MAALLERVLLAPPPWMLVVPDNIQLLDARAHGQPAEAATYMNESLWPSQKEADTFSQAERPGEVKKWLDELRSGIDIVKTVRYVDEGG